MTYQESLKDRYSVACLEYLGEPSFHKHSCWKLASISGRQLAGEEWALPAGVKKLKLRIKNNFRHTCITIKPCVLVLFLLQASVTVNGAAPPSPPPRATPMPLFSGFDPFYFGGFLSSFIQITFLAS